MSEESPGNMAFDEGALLTADYDLHAPRLMASEIRQRAVAQGPDRRDWPAFSLHQRGHVG